MLKWLIDIRHFILRALGITLEAQLGSLEAKLLEIEPAIAITLEAQLRSLEAKLVEIESAFASLEPRLQAGFGATEANIINAVDKSTAAHAQALAQNEARLGELLADLRTAADAAYEHQIAVLASIINNQHGMNGEIAEIRQWVDRAAMGRALAG